MIKIKGFSTVNLIISLSIFVSESMLAQDNIEAFVETFDADDGNPAKLYQAYIDPLITSFGYGVSNGWYNTAKTHKSFGIDLSITGTTVYVPDDELFYNPDELGLVGVDFTGPDETYPTILGPENPVPRFNVQGGAQNVEGPAGFEFTNDLPNVFQNAGLVPMIQLGVGIVKETDVKVRFASDFGTVDDFSFTMWGIGVQHGINQWIPALERFPLDFAVLFAYTNISSDFEDFDDSAVDDRIELGSNALTFQVLASKQFSVLTLYSGFGFNRTGNDLTVTGNFNNGEIIDPVPDLSFNASSARATFGARLKFGFFSLFTDYTFQKFDMWTMGISLVNIREKKRLF